MLSRVAANLYWLSRYLERSDGILRMLKIHFAFSQDSLKEFSWAPVLKIYSNLSGDDLSAIEYRSREVLLYMFAGKDNLNSIVNIITLARENARSVQDHIPKDLWQCLNEYYHLVKDQRFVQALRKGDPASTLDELIRQVMLFYGIAEVTMERSEGRSFMNIGKFLERSIQSADILDIKLEDTEDPDDLLSGTSYLKYLLLSLGAFDLYQKTYRRGFDTENVWELVLFNEAFPRSVLYSVNSINRYFERLKTNKYIIEHRDISFLVGRLQSTVQYTTTKSIRQQGLHAYLLQVKRELYDIGNALNTQYFAYS